MHLRRRLATLVSAALVGSALTLLSTAAPAAADTPTTIAPFSGTSWLTYGYRSQPGAQTYGGAIYFSIDVVSTDGSEDPYVGTVTVQRQVKGSSAWTTIAESTYPGYSGSTKAVGNATYRVIYSGGSSSTTTWAATSAAKTVKIQREVATSTLSGKKAGFKGKLKPGTKTKITVFKKKGKRYKKFKKLRSSRKGRFTVVLPAPRRGKFHWKIVFSGDRRFVKSTLKGYTYKR